MTKCIALLVALGLSGCMYGNVSKQKQDISSGYIGCPASEITIINGEGDMTQRNTWVAICKNKKFHCTALPSIACKEEIK